MHLGSNLRKAFLLGVKRHTFEQEGVNQQPATATRDYHKVDVLVHEFYKLFGKGGTPEYGCGVLAFPDFLKLMSTPGTSQDPENTSYYQLCLSLSLDCQVGSRYFVTASNAAVIMYLRKAAISFLEYTGRNLNGNKLEKDLHLKLNNFYEIVHLKADAHMFCHVYADLVTLAKSRELQKSVLDMNIHYFELLTYTKNIQDNPQDILNPDTYVFKSEKKLYSADQKFNHRLRRKFKIFQEFVFRCDEWDDTFLYPLVATGAAAMESKLSTYAGTQLPGGIYWDPEPEVRAVLSTVEPINDVCESILGLNDYLNVAIPNMSQEAHSNLIEVKKNKTINQRKNKKW